MEIFRQRQPPAQIVEEFGRQRLPQLCHINFRGMGNVRRGNSGNSDSYRIRLPLPGMTDISVPSLCNRCFAVRTAALTPIFASKHHHLSDDVPCAVFPDVHRSNVPLQKQGFSRL